MKLENIRKNSHDYLKELEQENKWVFHGSSKILKKIEPRQAYKSKDGERVSDGEPAVFATPYADIAIFMAIFSPENVDTSIPGKYKSGYSVRDGQTKLKVTKDLMNQAGSKRGYVHVLDRNYFIKRSASDVISHSEVRPSEVIEVRAEDLPMDIVTL